MYFKNQKFLVAGMSKSGVGSANFLLSRGAEVYIYDDVISDKIAESMTELSLLGALVVTVEKLNEAIDKCDILVISPGIPIDNPLPVAFRKQSKAIIGEEELAALYLRATAVAVTGTNGKTTTVSLINNVLQKANLHSVMCGNIGNPLINEVENLTFDDYAVIEISSFQLETLFNLKPHISVITNITEDHLNRHYNMENYIYLKSKMVRCLKESEYVVLNFDDEIVRSFAQNTRGKVAYISINKTTNGAYLEENYICYQGNKLFKVENLLIGGIHNVYNVLAALTVCKILGLDDEVIVNGLCSFKGVKHRIEVIDIINDVTYIDDSKGTNVDATVKAVESMNAPTIILLGGKDKGYDYTNLFKFLEDSRVVHAVLYGENRFRLMNAAIGTNFKDFSLCQSFEMAVRLASMIAKPAQNVLLSPASSSFDCFSNYEERGEAFARLVGLLADENKR